MLAKQRVTHTCSSGQLVLAKRAVPVLDEMFRLRGDSPEAKPNPRACPGRERFSVPPRVRG